MRSVILVLLLQVLYGILSVQGDGPVHYDLADAANLFEKYVKDFKKVYKDDKDKETHFEQFKKNLQIVNDLNEKNYPQTTFGINQFTDLNDEEMKEHKGFTPPKSEKRKVVESN